MTIRVAINGFGRIGRMVFRAAWGDPEIEFVAVNNRSSTELTGNLLKHESVHGPFPGDVSWDETHLIVDGKKILKLTESDPKNLPWKELNIDVVVESTGVFRTKEKAAMHLEAGAKKVLISAPAKGDEPVTTIVKGVNDEVITEDVRIASNASCTTNCFAPVAKIINDNYTIESGFMVTVHAYTADQRLVDDKHKDIRRARAAALNLVPTTSGAAIATCEVIPALKGKLKAEAVRAPVPDGSMVYFVCSVANPPADTGTLNKLFKDCAEHVLNGVLEYSEEPLVSTDIINNPHSSILDGQLTDVNGKLIKVVAWYDNEYGYSCRIVDVIKMMGR